MFSKFFNLTKSNDGKKINNSSTNQGDKKSSGSKSFQIVVRSANLKCEDIRILIYKESERRSDKTLLFDSDAVIAVQDEVPSEESRVPKTPTSTPTSSHPYKCSRPNHDVKMLGEMIMGSVAMVFKGDVLKVHRIRFPPQLIMTKVFALKPRTIGLSYSEKSFHSQRDDLSNKSIQSDTVSLDNDIIPRSQSNPLEMMKTSSMRRSYGSVSSLCTPSAHNSTLDETSWSMSGSIVSLDSISPACSPCGSIKQRYFRSRNQSLDSPYFLRTKLEISDEVRSIYKHQPKIGIGIIFKLWDRHEYDRDFQRFFFAHFTIIEAHLQRLRIKIEKSFYLRQHFMDVAVAAVNSFKNELMDLYYTPRIRKPFWSTLSHTVSKNESLSTVQSWMKCFVKSAEYYETKEKNYFLSTLLTSLLTNHLSWTSTVVPSNIHIPRKSRSRSTKSLSTMFMNQYNAQWDQLRDLYGCLSDPPQYARTIVSGENKDSVYEMLSFITLFLRCFNVCEAKKVQLKSKKTMSNFVKVQRFIRSSLEREEKLSKNIDVCFNSAPSVSLCMCSSLQNIPVMFQKSSGKGHSILECELEKPEIFQPFFNTPKANGKSQDIIDILLVLNRHTNEEQLALLDNFMKDRKNSNKTDVSKCFDRLVSNNCSVGPSHPTFTCYCCESSCISNTQLNNSYKDLCFCYGFEVSKLLFFEFQRIFCRTICCDQAYVDHSIMTEDLKTLNLKYFPMPRFDIEYDKPGNGKLKVDNIGKSLFAGYTSEINEDFALQGVHEVNRSNIAKLLQNSIRCPALDENVSNAVSIIADTDKGSCEIMKISKVINEDNSSSSELLESNEMYPSSLVSELIETTCELYKLGLSPEFCLVHIEEQMRDAVNLSKVSYHISQSLGNEAATSFFKECGFHESDTDFINAVSSTFK